MAEHADLLEQQDSLSRWVAASVALHAAVVAALLIISFGHFTETVQWGDRNGGGIGSVAVTPVQSIPLPPRSGQLNPVANDTRSRVPTPPPQTKPKPQAKAEDLNAIPIPSRNASKHPSRAAPERNTFREKQTFRSNQLYSDAGQAAVSPIFGKTGGGGVALGNNSPFGYQFGWYANLLRDKVARNWNTTTVDPRIQTAPAVVVTFTIQRDGSVPSGSVRVTQSSGNLALDLSAERAILDAAPFQPLPQQFPHNQVDIEFWFELKR